MWHECRKVTRIGYWWESQREIDHYEDQDIGGGGDISLDLGGGME
jgi:hypothetical protein